MLGVIGAGHMARAIVSGLIQEGWVASDIIVSDVMDVALESMKQEFGVKTTRENQLVIAESSTVLLAVKPQQFEALLNEIRPTLGSDKLIFSIAAGISTSYIHKVLAQDVAIVRAMPNLAAQVRQAITALYANPFVTPEQKKTAQSIAHAMGEFAWISDEADMHAVTAVSGSGPGYFFYFLQALIEGGKAEGLDEDLAHKLAVKTALGAAEFVLAQEDVSLGEMVQMVSSKGGTTEAAIGVFDDAHLDAIVQKAVARAAARSRELSEG